MTVLMALVLLQGATSARALTLDEQSPAGASQLTGAFGSLEFRTNATKGLGEWQRLLARLGKQARLYHDCDKGKADCPAYLRDWRKNLRAWSDLDTLGQIVRVNAYVNSRIRYADDITVFGRRDFWATPADSLKGRGDCEDYAIAKYESLRALGIPEHSLRLVIVDDLRRKLGHVVLTVNTSAGLYVLDNLRSRPYLHGRVSHYAPIYSINRTGRWINVAARRTAPVAVATITRDAEGSSLAEALRPALDLDVAADPLTLRPSLTIEPATGSDLVTGSE
jgi:predicted transglutaminase-like cysteine proteinase